MTTEHFVDIWNTLTGGKGEGGGGQEESYTKVPPNTALVFDEKQNGILQDTFVIELYNPICD